MATFQTVGDIEKAIAKGLKEIPNAIGFRSRIKKDLAEAIDENVYSWPPGSRYVRRYDKGGLGDKRYFEFSSGKAESFRGTGQTVGEDDEGFMAFIETEVSEASITIYVEDNAPVNSAYHKGSGQGEASDKDGTLAYMVEHGIGKGNMSYERPFYDPADEKVESDSDYLEELAAQIISQFLD